MYSSKPIDSPSAPLRGGGFTLFGNLRVMVCAALLSALSIVLGKYLAINLSDSVRISFENLPILMAGLSFGPAVGVAVGVVADLLGCLMVGYTINPLITLGAALIGAVSGLFSCLAFPRCPHPWGTWRVWIPTLASHAVGSVLVKTIGMMVYYGTPAQIFYIRIPLYLGVGLAEGYLMMLLFGNSSFQHELTRIIHRDKRHEGSK